VINAAAYTAVDQAEDEPQKASRINGEAAGEVAAAALEAGASVIQISTDYVFDGRAEGEYAPDETTSPLGAYGRSKLLGEELVRAASPNHAIVRTSWVYSSYGKNFVKTMMALAESRDEVGVVADQFGNPSSAHDLADGLLAMLARWATDPKAGLGETFHLAGTGTTSWFDFAAATFEQCARLGVPAARVMPIRTANWPTRAERPRNSALDSSKFAATFGYRMPRWRDSLSSVVSRLVELRTAAR
jgi:dTDP-4-dehydrorhamnose reductase